MPSGQGFFRAAPLFPALLCLFQITTTRPVRPAREQQVMAFIRSIVARE